MKRFASFLFPVLSAAALLCASPSFAGDHEAKSGMDKPESVAPAGEPEPGAEAPEGMSPEQAAMMQAGEARWVANMTPGQPHQNLAKLEGKWNAALKNSMGPGTGQWIESKGEATFKMILGGRYLKQKFSCMMAMPGEEPMPFEGLGLTGYNNRTKRFESTWMDNTGTAINVSRTAETTGLDNGESVSIGTFYNPYMDMETQTKEVGRWMDDDTYVFEYHTQMPDGSWWLVMSITYTRK